MEIVNVVKFELTDKELEMVEEVMRITQSLHEEGVFDLDPFSNYYHHDIVDYLENLLDFSGENLY